ncbi:MAG: hypothetical protein ACR65T_02660 [Methylocystis sp.]|uniref:hypothetical protein n=1 Tax=Methylocystis sp. TaxID=1911079 RepID=UPI003DA4D52B
MESIVKTLQSVFPLLIFYPNWAQALFLVTFLLTLLSFAVFVVTYNQASEAQKQAEGTKFADIRLASPPPSSAQRQEPTVGPAEEMESPNAFRSSEFANEFPVIDLKFQNPGKISEMITRLKLLVRDVNVNITPSIEYSLVVADGDLFLELRNFGWGSAREVSVEVDLSPFGSALLTGKVRKIELAELPPAVADANGVFSATKFTVLKKDQLKLTNVPQTLRVQQTNEVAKANEKSFWALQHKIESNGLHGLNAHVTYSDQYGKNYSETVTIQRIERSVYDNKNIYYGPRGFMYVEYDRGIRYSLIAPSASYNFLVDVEKPHEISELSVAHEVPAGGFDRLAVTVGATKSSLLRFQFEFVTNTGRTVLSPHMSIEIWNPRNTFVNVEGGKRVNNLLPSKNAREEPYDVNALKASRSRSWGY